MRVFVLSFFACASFAFPATVSIIYLFIYLLSVIVPCVHTGRHTVSVLSQAIFKPCSLQRALPPPSHFLKCLCGNVSAALSDYRLFSLLCALALLNQNLLLTAMSATIKVSPIAGVMLLKGFACLLEAGSGNTLGCHLCYPGMRQNSLECQ